MKSLYMLFWINTGVFKNRGTRRSFLPIRISASKYLNPYLLTFAVSLSSPYRNWNSKLRPMQVSFLLFNSGSWIHAKSSWTKNVSLFQYCQMISFNFIMKYQRQLFSYICFNNFELLYVTIIQIIYTNYIWTIFEFTFQ